MASLPLGWRTKLPSPWPTLILEMDLKISTNFNMLWIFRMDPRKTNGWNHAKMCGLGYVFFLFQGWKHQTNMFSFSGFRCPMHTLVFVFILILDPQIIEVISIPLGRWELRNIIFKKVGLFFHSFQFLFPSNDLPALYWVDYLRSDLRWKEPTSGMRLCWLPMAATWQWSSGEPWNVGGDDFLRR